MKKYAYLDAGESAILHVTDSKEVVESYSRDGKMVEVDSAEVDEETGFPIVDGDEYFYYHTTQECFKNGNRKSKHAEKVKLPEVLAKIVEQL